MPAFERSPADLGARFATVMAEYPEAPVRPMFGSPCAFVNGNLATGLFGSGWFVRLDPASAGELLAIDGAGVFAPMPGRAMKGYVLLPEATVADDQTLRTWVERALAFAASLPPKPTKSAKPSKASKATSH